MIGYAKQVIVGFKTLFTTPPPTTDNNQPESQQGRGDRTIHSSFDFRSKSLKRSRPSTTTFEEQTYFLELTDDEEPLSTASKTQSYYASKIKKSKYSFGLEMERPSHVLQLSSRDKNKWNTTVAEESKRSFLKSSIRRGQANIGNIFMSGMGNRGINSDNRMPGNSRTSTPISNFGSHMVFPSLNNGSQKRSCFGQTKSIGTSSSSAKPKYPALPVKPNHAKAAFSLEGIGGRNPRDIDVMTLDDDNGNSRDKSSTYKFDKGVNLTVNSRFSGKTPVKAISGGFPSAYWSEFFGNKVNKPSIAKTAAKLDEKNKYKKLVEDVMKSQFSESRYPGMTRISNGRLNETCGPLVSSYFATTRTETPLLHKDRELALKKSLESHEHIKSLFRTFDDSTSEEGTPIRESPKVTTLRSTTPPPKLSKTSHLPSEQSQMPNQSRVSNRIATPYPIQCRTRRNTTPHLYSVPFKARISSMAVKSGSEVSSRVPRENVEIVDIGSSSTSSSSSRSLSENNKVLSSNEYGRDKEAVSDSDDDIKILAESILAPQTRKNSFSLNSLELETRQSNFSKRWLHESSASFKENRQRRENQINVEKKTIEILKSESDLDNELAKKIRNNLTITGIIILEESEPVLPEITDEMSTDIQKALKFGNDNEVLATAFNIQITRADLKTLAPCKWLNDNVINTYMDMIAERSRMEKGRYPSVHVFTTFFYPKYLKEGYSNVLKRWTRKVDIFSFDLLIFPIHLGIHWCLAVADLRNKTLCYYDSLLGNQTMCVNALLKYLSCEMKERKKMELNNSDWKLELVKEIPTQENGSDCGVFTCKFAEYLSRDAKLTFKQADMDYYRHRMIYEIMRQDLLFP